METTKTSARIPSLWAQIWTRDLRNEGYPVGRDVRYQLQIKSINTDRRTENPTQSVPNAKVNPSIWFATTMRDVDEIRLTDDSELGQAVCEHGDKH
jgi:hypothetical protein